MYIYGWWLIILGGDNMNKVLNTLANIGIKSATASVSEASQWFLYQEKEPKNLVEYVEKKRK
jgi:cyclic lactone autoinducer peptide